MSDAKKNVKADENTGENEVENKPVEKADAQPEVAPSAANPTWQKGEPVEVNIGNDEWRLAVYKDYFPQYNYHTVLFANGTSFTGNADQIRNAK